MFLGISDGWSRNDLYVVDVPAWRRTGEIVKVAIAEGLDGRFEPAVVGQHRVRAHDLRGAQRQAIAVDRYAPAAASPAPLEGRAEAGPGHRATSS